MKLIILGAGGHGRVCADTASLMNAWDEIMFADDHPPATYPYPLIGTIDEALRMDAAFCIAIGDSIAREEVYTRLKQTHKRIQTLIHPSAIIGSRVKIGEGSVILPGAVINSDTTLGICTIVNTCASIDHNCSVGDFVHVAVGAHLCGAVNVSSHTWIGAGVIVKEDLSICSNCLIGTGAVVVKDIEVSGKYVGVPAKCIREA